MSIGNGNSQYFGQFLLENALISAPQLRAAVTAQQDTESTRLGMQAISAGFLTSAQVEQIHAARGASRKSFSELALSQDLLTKERLQALLSTQMDECVTLGEALVESQALDAQALGKHLEQFNSNVYVGQDGLSELFSGRPNPNVVEVIASQFSEISMKLLQVFVQAESWVDDPDSVLPCEYTVYQKFKGDWTGQVRLNISTNLMLRIGSKLLEEETLIINKTIIDGACEFVSILTGNICAKLSTMGLSVGIQPPRYIEHPAVGARSGKRSGLGDIVGSGSLTAVRMAHPTETIELCIIDHTAV